MTRAGVFPYRNHDGTTRLELRLPDEVFKADSLDSLGGAVVTQDHPPAMINPENAREFAVGSVGTDVRKDGTHVVATVTLFDRAAIDAAESGDQREVSCGYHCALEVKSGTHPKFGRYDVIQRNIRYNHVAILGKGRAGSDVRLRLDSADAVMVDDPAGFIPPQPEPGRHAARTDGAPTMRITLDGIDYETDNLQLAQALNVRDQKSKADAVARVDAAKEAADKLATAEARADELEKERDELKAKLDDAESPEKFSARIDARVALETKARVVIGGTDGKPASFDGMTDREIRVAVLDASDIDSTDKADAYVEARFDAAVERATEKASEPNKGEAKRDSGTPQFQLHAGGKNLDAARGRAVGRPPRKDGDDEDPADKMAREIRERSTQPITGQRQ